MFIFKNKVQILRYNYKKTFLIHKERTHSILLDQPRAHNYVT